MSKLYNEEHRAFQDAFETRTLADAVESIILQPEFTDKDKAFIESRNMFFLSTVDHMGRPSVSYKGGNKGFIKIISNDTLIFPSYDGNGMFLSMGNIKISNKIGLLFIDFENPHRLRAYGEATVSADDPLLKQYEEAQLLVKVKITELWRNCPRYIHKYKKMETSKYIPQTNRETPLPDWKKLDKLQGILPSKDQGIAEQQGGTLTLDQLQEIEHRED